MRFGFREEKAFGRGILRSKNPSEEDGRRQRTVSDVGEAISVMGLEREGLRGVRELKKGEKKGIKENQCSLI